MPTPLDSIREGLEKKNWELVNFGYLSLTGTDVLGEQDNSELFQVAEEKPTRQSRKKPPTRPAKAAKPKKATKPRTPRKKPPTVIVEPQRDPNDFSMPVGQPQKNDSEKVQAKLEQVSLSNKKAWSDDKLDFNTERRMSKQPKGVRTTPSRPAIKMITINCTRCSRPNQVMENELLGDVSYICRGCLKGIYQGR